MGILKKLLKLAKGALCPVCDRPEVMGGTSKAWKCRNCGAYGLVGGETQLGAKK